jgi:hypothetical protein
MSEEIIEETPVEETPVEEPTPEPTPEPEQQTPTMHTFGRVMNVPDEMLNYLADGIYPAMIPKPLSEITPDTPLEARMMQNPVPKLEWMQDWFDQNMVELFLTRFETEVNNQTNQAIADFTATVRAQAQQMIDAKREQVRGLIVRA